jgi:hypothetical protein
MFSIFQSIPEVMAESCAIGFENKNINKNKDQIYIPCNYMKILTKHLRILYYVFRRFD